MLTCLFSIPKEYRFAIHIESTVEVLSNENMTNSDNHSYALLKKTPT